MSFGIKEVVMTGAIIGALSILGYNKIYLKYVEKTTDVALKEIDRTKAKEGYLLCKSLDPIQITRPNQKCLDFYTEYVPLTFKNDKTNQFPIEFSNENEFVDIYNLIQNILEEYGEKALPSLTELTNGRIKS
ncbi:TPA: hypothetical protein KD832_003098 [Vibrio parahaemolyticus]|nr:hypothetical protein [Vibrio parahaemolyticus]